MPGAGTLAPGILLMGRVRSLVTGWRVTVVAVLGLVCFTFRFGTDPSSAQTDTRRGGASIQAILALSNAIHALGDPSSNYRKILADTATALSSNADDEIRADVRGVLMRMPQPGPGFRCSPDFIRLRARLALLRIRDRLLNTHPDPIEPAVCYAVPFAVDSTRGEMRDSVVEIYGYDFDAAAPQMVLVTRDGYQDVTSGLVARSHYHLVFDLSGVVSSSNNLSLGLAWGHLIRHSVVLIRPTMPLCPSRVETIPAGRMISYEPPRIGSAGSPARPGIRITADASLNYSNNKVEAMICMTANRDADDTLFSGCRVEFLYTTDPDSVIDGIFGDLQNQVAYTHGAGSVDMRRGARNGPVRRWTVSGFGSPEVSVTAELNAIRVVSTADYGCISPQAYAEARRTSAVSAATGRVLDPLLQRIDPAIVKLRPRFAPPSPPAAQLP